MNLAAGRAVKQPIYVAPFIEHTNLKPEATQQDIARLCEEAQRFHFYGVCVNPCFVELATRKLKNTEVAVVSVVGFPLGANLSATKAEEAKRISQLGATEIDMVLPIGAIRSGGHQYVYEDIRSVTEVSNKDPVKVIIETCL